MVPREVALDEIKFTEYTPDDPSLGQLRPYQDNSRTSTSGTSSWLERQLSIRTITKVAGAVIVVAVLAVTVALTVPGRHTPAAASSHVEHDVHHANVEDAPRRPPS